MKTLHYLLISTVVASAIYANNNQTLMQSENFYEKDLKDLLNIETELKAEVGSRSGDRDATLSEVPIDIVTAEQIKQSGSTELSQILQRYVPGFNFPRPTMTDGTDHARPFTLRGLNPDQVLVLINGKRLHSSSLLNVNGTIGSGTSSVDLNTIAVAAIERVEILRDGAAAQYGSDAIAGVINIILKGYGHKNEVSVSYGQTKEGDGQVKDTSIFYTLPLQYDGFFNITAQYRDRASTTRSPNENLRYGDADTQDKLLAINNEIITKNGTIIYIDGILNQRDSEAGAFYRGTNKYSEDAYAFSIYPNGFLPLISPKITDYSITVGVKDTFDNGIKYDTSLTHGINEYNFYVHNTLNFSLGEDSPTSFDSGGTSYHQDIFNLNLSKKFDNFDLATGLEYRKENYKINSGDVASYAIEDDSVSGGAQGFPGFQPNNEVDAKRSNSALYLDATYKPLKSTTIGIATRYENYSDFGDTFNNKLYMVYRPTPKLLFRTTGSTGFRAPSLSQAYYTSTTTVKSTGALKQKGIFGVDHLVAQELGAVDLKPEESKHFSAGLVYEENSNLSFAIDYFYTLIDDRIMLGEGIDASISEEVGEILNKYGVEQAAYFSNAINTKTTGIDVRLKYKHKFENGGNLKTTLAYHYASTEVTDVNTAPSILGENGADLLVSEYSIIKIANAQPKDDIKLLTFYNYQNYNFKLNINKFGSYKSIWGGNTETFKSKWITDIELGYEVNANLKISLGAENLLDVYPDKWSSEWATNNVPYTQFSPFGYNGAYYYTHLEYKF